MCLVFHGPWYDFMDQAHGISHVSSCFDGSDCSPTLWTNDLDAYQKTTTRCRMGDRAIDIVAESVLVG